MVYEPCEGIDCDHHQERDNKLEPQVVVHHASVEGSLKHDFDEAYHVVLKGQINGAIHHHELDNAVAAITIGKPLGEGNVGGNRHHTTGNLYHVHAVLLLDVDAQHHDNDGNNAKRKQHGCASRRGELHASNVILEAVAKGIEWHVDHRVPHVPIVLERTVDGRYREHDAGRKQPLLG